MPNLKWSRSLLVVNALMGIAVGNEEAAVADKDSAYSETSTPLLQPKKRVTLFGLDEVLKQANSEDNPRLNYEELHADDLVEDSFFDPFSLDSSCLNDDESDDCWHPPSSTVEEELVEVADDQLKSPGLEHISWGYGGNDPDDVRDEDEASDENEECRDDKDSRIEGDKNPQCKSNQNKMKKAQNYTVLIDKHWGSDPTILRMRDRLRGTRSRYWDLFEQQQELIANTSSNDDNTNDTENAGRPVNAKLNSTKRQSQRRPPVFLLPGLASTRLVSWKHKPCPQSALLSDIKMLDNVWLNMNLLIQMATIDVRCWIECMTLAKFQRDYDENEEWNSSTDTEDSRGSGWCKLRPDEGLDAISSLAPGSISSSWLVGGTNTVYAWLIQWLADNLGYDVSSILALPYDWRLSPDMMEERDGFLTMTRHKIEAAVKSNGLPGIMVAHSMGNSVFRYFQEWLRVQMREEAYGRFAHEADKTAVDAATLSEENSIPRRPIADTVDSLPHRGPFWRRAWVRHYLPGGVSGNGVDQDYVGLEDVNSGSNDEQKNCSDTHEDDKSNQNSENARNDNNTHVDSNRKYPKLWDLAKVEGDRNFVDWLGKHIWTYVGLAAPLLGAPGPLKSVLSGENMGLPFTHEEARAMELSFGSTHTVNPISTKMGFCDVNTKKSKSNRVQNRNLACLDELIKGIESSRGKQVKGHDPWRSFPALRLLLKDRVDFDSNFPMFRIEREYCKHNKCHNKTTLDFGPEDIMNGRVFDSFSKVWKEKNNPLRDKKDQLAHSWWNAEVPNPLISTPERPHIKHVVMAYGCDVPTEASFVYKKTEHFDESSNSTASKTEGFDGIPAVSHVMWEEQHGKLILESKESSSFTFTDTILRKKKQIRRVFNVSDQPQLHQSGDGTIPYISLMWAHTWLLHATRAVQTSNETAPMKDGERISNPNNALDSIKVSHRPKGGNEWEEGYGANPQTAYDTSQESRSNLGDTGTAQPHGTKYKPKMVRFQSSGKSRSTGMEYTTTVIEAIGVEHKETTRNYDILAATFTDVLKNLHNDYGLV